jgi:hypothetical protein
MMFANGSASRCGRVLLGLGLCVAVTSASLAEELRETLSPPVDSALREMGAALKSMQAFSFSIDISVDEILPDGEKVESNRRSVITVVRPDRFKGTTTSGPELDKQFLFDGMQLSIIDRVAKVYSVTDMPGTIDEMLDQLYEKYGISVPTADFLYSDVYQVLTADAQSGRYIGKCLIRGQLCHHLAVRLENVDYQIWITVQDKPMPRRMVLTYKDAEESPQFRIDFDGWKALDAPAMSEFKLDIPSSYSKVELKAAETEAPEKSENGSSEAGNTEESE